MVLALCVAAAVAVVATNVIPRFNRDPLRLPLQETLWSGIRTPRMTMLEAGAPVELGIALRPAGAGIVTGLRFYKVPGDVGPHTASLWSEGERLATVAYTDETDSGWQEAPLPTPVPVDARARLVISYFSPTGAKIALGDASLDAPPPQRSPSKAFVDPPGDQGPTSLYHLGASAFPSTDAGPRSFWIDAMFVPEGSPR